jgi:hypothetical protein
VQDGVGGQQHAPAALFTPDKDPAPIVHDAGLALGPSLDRCGNHAPTGI